MRFDHGRVVCRRSFRLSRCCLASRWHKVRLRRRGQVRRLFRVAGTDEQDGRACARGRSCIARERKESAATGIHRYRRRRQVPIHERTGGKISLNGARRGFISAGYDQHDQYSSAIVTGAAIDTENLVLQLAPRAAISGRVLDESGEPIRHARASASILRQSPGRGEPHRPSHSGQTDDLGGRRILD